MPHPLDGARLKVCRAEEHLQTLKETIADYVGSVPYELAAEDDGEAVNLVLTLTSHPDPAIGAVIGDCLHNLRSALDYLMWELAGTYVNRRLEPPPGGKDKVYFPICGTAGAFHKNASTLAKYKIPGAVLTQLEAVQPYHGGFESLEKLHNLTNVDKHRLPLLVCAAIDRMVFDLGEIAALTRGTKLPQDSMRNNISLFVAWQDRSMPKEPVDAVLSKMLDCVQSVLRRFDRFVL